MINFDFWFGHTMPLHATYCFSLFRFFFFVFASPFKFDNVIESFDSFCVAYEKCLDVRCTCRNAVADASFWLVCTFKMAKRKEYKCYVFTEDAFKMLFVHFPSEWVFNATLWQIQRILCRSHNLRLLRL